jgi:micrococcal nuclease
MKRIIFVLLVISLLANIFLDHGSRYKVIYVIDGDTIVLENGEHVRYIGVDAPELHHPNKPVECFAIEASEKNEQLVLNRYVTLENDIEDKDQYGRLLRYVYINGKFVNGILVREGFAYSYYYPPNVKQYDELLKLELSAQSKTIGLWSECIIQ